MITLKFKTGKKNKIISKHIKKRSIAVLLASKKTEVFVLVQVLDLVRLGYSQFLSTPLYTSSSEKRLVTSIAF